MPHIKVRGIQLEEVKQVSQKLIEDLAVLTEVAKEHFTLEYIHSTYIVDGKEDANMYPFVEVDWFYRGDAVMDQAATIITDHLGVFNYSDVAVYFRNLKKHHYYENGKHF